jgi:hypothetical protein
MTRLQNFVIPRLALISMIVFTGCGSSSTESSENKKNLENFRIAHELFLIPAELVPSYYEAVYLANPEETKGQKAIFIIAKDLAEAEGAAREYRKSEYEVIRTVVADYVSDIALALEAVLNSISTKNDVELAKAIAQYEYLVTQVDKISSCMRRNNLSC